MPRIDEALARARSQSSEDPLPAPAAAAAIETGVEFPVETAEVSAGEALPAGQLPDEDLPKLLKPITDLPRLPLAEKLSPTCTDAASIEQYRRLAARLYLMQSERRTPVVMVTSAMPGEGKTLTAANLALTLSESYRRNVLLVDADLRRPWMHHVFDVPNLAGLTESLRSEVERKVPLIVLTEHLTLLPAGSPDVDPMSALSSDRMRRVLEEAGAKFDWVIIDTPPVGLLTDARLLGSLVDTVLLVVQAGRTPLASIKAAVQAIGRDRILGVVLNRSDNALQASSYSYYNSNYRVSA